MHIYAFGSVCRGDVDRNSDVDLIAIVEGQDNRFDTNKYSVYSYKRLNEIYVEGNPFAWHLHLESVLIYSDTKTDILKDIVPHKYLNSKKDCEKFYSIFLKAKESLLTQNMTQVFDMSTVFLSIRNFATCYSLGNLRTPCFSRNSAVSIEGDSIGIDMDIYNALMKARVLATRGIGDVIPEREIEKVINNLELIENWMKNLIMKIEETYV